MKSLLVTNDFPPKVGGIQSYLWELWRRLPPDDVGVLTIEQEGAAAFDASQAYEVERIDTRMLVPTRSMRRRVEAMVAERGAELVFVDPAFPIGAVGPRLDCPYAVITHGAEVTVYRHVPLIASVMRNVFRRAVGIVAAGGYPARQAAAAARASLEGVVVPPGVDPERFRPLTDDERGHVRERHGIDPDRPLVLGVSRLVPRKGFDVLIDAVAPLPGVQLAIAGGGRDRERLERRAARHGMADRTHFLGRVPDDELPGIYGSADVFSMPCRDRWRGLEQEGFGIVFLEAAACGVPAVAGRSGGSHEAIVDEETGFVVEPSDAAEVRGRLVDLLDDDGRRRAMGEAARSRAVADFDYDVLAERLAPLAQGDLSVLGPLET